MAAPLALHVQLAAVPSRGSQTLFNELFEPLGYQIAATRHPLDKRFPEWGDGCYYSVSLSAKKPLFELLAHLYVLIPVLDNDKHYWVGSDELEKLLKRGEGWLADHPARELIVTRYLKYGRGLTREALARLSDDDESDPDAKAKAHADEEAQIERPLSLNQQRHDVVCAELIASGAKRVLDLGCAEGVLLRRLMGLAQFEMVVGLDVSLRSLEVAERRLRFDRLSEQKRSRIKLLHGSLMYRDDRLRGFDAAALVEVIEHFDKARLGALERVVFEHARPRTVVVTTPNVEYNARFESLPAGQFRHRDHRFEWTRRQFDDWARAIGKRFDYRPRLQQIGEQDPDVGAPTQMAVFEART